MATTIETHEPTTDDRYKSAVALYTSTSLSCRAIAETCAVPYHGLNAYLNRKHRELVLARNGIRIENIDDAKAFRLRKRQGQTRTAQNKYNKAIEACRDERYLPYNVSQIANIFKLDGTALANQLRAHTDIIKWREEERQKRGLNDNIHRGARPQSVAKYQAAVELLASTDKTIFEVANICGVSFSGLKAHLLFYHKDLIKHRLNKREAAPADRKRGTVNRNGGKYKPQAASVKKYRKALKLYRTTPLTIKEIAEKCNVSGSGFRSYLRMWNKQQMIARYSSCVADEVKSASVVKRYSKAASVKYAEPIKLLQSDLCQLTVSEVARKYGLHIESFRNYVTKHYPQIIARTGMTTGSNGKSVSARSVAKYAKAIRLYQTSQDSLKNIALHLGLTYNSLGGFVRRHYPELIQGHKNKQNYEFGNNDIDRKNIQS